MRLQRAFMRALVLAVLVAATVPALAAAQAPDPSGVYLSESGNTRVRIAPCGNWYCGTILGIKGDPRDVSNPDPKLRDRSLVGLNIISDFKPSGDGFEGTLYSYKDGKTYTGKATFAASGAMQLSGCVFGGLICRTQVWTKVN